MIPWLTLLIAIPLLGSVITLLLPKGEKSDATIKWFSIIWSLIPLAIASYLWFGGMFDPNNAKMQFEETYIWIQAINVKYHVGIDGLSMPLVWLTTLLTTLSLYYSARTIHERAREFFFMFLLLEAGMLGVFVSLDFFLFYVFWELGLVPMYFLIAIWGHAEDRPLYSSIKFFLYTLAGSVFMLLAIIAMYINTSSATTPGTFDIIELAARRPFANDFVFASLAFWGNLSRVRDQSAALPVPHLVARCAHRRANCWLGHPRGHPAKTRHVRFRPRPRPDFPASLPGERDDHRDSRGNLDCLRRARGNGANRFQATHRILIRESYGLCDSRHRGGGCRG
jgi:hypothetical protein